VSIRIASALVFGGVLAAATAAHAHVSVASGPAFANKSQKITFSIAHGCTNSDTVKLTIDIPAGVTSVRPIGSDFGKPSVTKDAAGVVTTVSWTKEDARVQTEDIEFYELTLRARIPDAAFSKIMFVAHQTCRDANGVESTVDWDQPAGSQTGEPAPLLVVVPPRLAGWNHVTLTSAITAADLPTYFGDALIVWRGTAAFSANPNTVTLIHGTTGVTELASDLAAGDELWVRY
jgi:uncharacterized protein YcnI